MIITNNQITPTGNSIKINDSTNFATLDRGVKVSRNTVDVPPVPGEIIEGLWSLCDGSTHVLQSGIYTVQNVNTFQALDNSHQDITGSLIRYVPPSEATKVYYSFSFSNYYVATSHGISHYKFTIDDIDVVYSRHNRSSSSLLETRYAFEWIIPIGGTADLNTGRQSNWTIPKTLKMKARDFSSGSNDANLHGTVNWDGVTQNTFNMPIIIVLALR